jgi:WD40 repeat protein
MLPMLVIMHLLTRLHTCAIHVQFNRALAFSPDGLLVASGDSAGVVKIWDVATHMCIMATGNSMMHEVR